MPWTTAIFGKFAFRLKFCTKFQPLFRTKPDSWHARAEFQEPKECARQTARSENRQHETPAVKGSIKDKLNQLMKATTHRGCLGKGQVASEKTQAVI